MTKRGWEATQPKQTGKPQNRGWEAAPILRLGCLPNVEAGKPSKHRNTATLAGKPSSLFTTHVEIETICQVGLPVSGFLEQFHSEFNTM